VRWSVVDVDVDVTYGLRGELLRRDRPDLPLHMADDDIPGAFHVAVRGDSGSVLGVASAMPEEPEFAAAAPAWRIRQMAVSAASQGRGIGTALFGGVVERARERGAATVWAESRTTSLGFYLARGMATVPARAHSVAGVDYVDVVLPLTP